MEIKIILLLILAASFIIYWILPRARIANRLRMNEPLFYIMHIIGILCGFSGIIVTFLYPEKIMANHIYELILLPVFLVYMYSAILLRKNKGEDIFDEKQNRDMFNAIAISWIVSFFGMFFIFALIEAEPLQNLIWFPLYMFLNILVFSASNLVFFTKG